MSTTLLNVASDSYGVGDTLAANQRLPGGVYLATLTGNIALDATYPVTLKLDPGGSARDVTLDAVASAEGLVRTIVNGADGAENLVCKNVGGSTIGTVNQNELGVFYCDGSTWALLYVQTIALS
jgi:hypothetical protein